MSLEKFLVETPVALQNEIIEIDAFLRSLRPLNLKRTMDKRKINYVSPEYGVSYAILPLGPELTQHFGWYYLHNKETKTWYRKTDYLEETLIEISKTDPQSAEHIFNSLNECTSCKGNPCSAVSYVYDAKQKLSCYGRVILSLCHDDFNTTHVFFQHLNALLEQRA